MKKLLVILLITLVLTACQPQTVIVERHPDGDDGTPGVNTVYSGQIPKHIATINGRGGVSRVMDEEYGIVCYAYSYTTLFGAISCVKVE